MNLHFINEIIVTFVIYFSACFLVFLLKSCGFPKKNLITTTFSLSRTKKNALSSLFIDSSFLPALKSGYHKCEGFPLKAISELKGIYQNQSEAEAFIEQKYHEFGKYQFKQASIDALHFLFSNLYWGSKDLRTCANFPSRFHQYINHIPHYSPPSCLLDSKWVPPEVFHFHHSLRFADQCILDYVKERDILDIGAMNGDSAYVLDNKTNEHIISFELTKQNQDLFLRNADILNFNMSKHILIPKGLSDASQSITYKKCSGGACSIDLNNTGSYLAEISTIDLEINDSYKIGFIKIDAEGFAYKILKGGNKTIQRDRPVFSIGIYHSLEELIKVYEFIDSLSNYLFEFQQQNNNWGTFGEMNLFAYPLELNQTLYNLKKGS